MTTRVELNGTDCLQADSPILCGPGTRTLVVVVPNDASKDLCSDGGNYDWKLIVFCNEEAMSVKCILKADLPRLQASVAGIQGTVDILPKVPTTLVKPITCPPPGMTAEEKQERFDTITTWMRKEYKPTTLPAPRAVTETDDGQNEDAVASAESDESDEVQKVG